MFSPLSSMNLVSNVIALAKLHVREEELHLKLDLIVKEKNRLDEEDQLILKRLNIESN